MSEISLYEQPPAAMPVLSRGRHRKPSRGACFMEYTALLAGEPFTDEPRCVDEELAAVLRGANDKLSGADRHVLVPLLGRAIGLAIEPPPVARRWWRRLAPADRERAARYHGQCAQLRRAVSRLFLAALHAPPYPVTQVRSGGGRELAWLFWDQMTVPTPLTRSEDYVRRLVERLRLLHECYEQAMDELGLSPAVPTGSAPVAGAAACPPTRPGMPSRLRARHVEPAECLDRPASDGGWVHATSRAGVAVSLDGGAAGSEPLTVRERPCRPACVACGGRACTTVAEDRYA